MYKPSAEGQRFPFPGPHSTRSCIGPKMVKRDALSVKGKTETVDTKAEIRFSGGSRYHRTRACVRTGAGRG